METTPLLLRPSKKYKGWSYGLTVFCCLASASFTCFSLYTSQFSSELGYTPVQINAIIIGAEIGLYTVVPFLGILADTIRLSVISTVAGVLYAVGYLAAYFAYVTRSSYVLMAIAFVFVAMATSGCYIVCVVNASRLQRESALLAIALPTTCYGASTLVFSQAFSKMSFFQLRAGINIPLIFGSLAVLTFVVGIISAVAPILGGTDCPDAVPDTVDEREEASPVIHVSHMTRFVYDHQTWLLLATFVFGSGPLEVYLNNLGIITKVTHPSVSTSSQISLYSMFSTVSRLAMGAYLDLYGHIFKPSFLLQTSFLLLAGTHICLALASLTPVRMSTISCLSGWVYGSFFTLYPVIITRVWGSNGFATYWGMFVAAPALGTLIYGSLFAWSYQAYENWSVSFGVSAPMLIICMLIIYRLQSKWKE